MIKSEDVERFRKIMKDLNSLITDMQSYNKEARVCVNTDIDDDESDSCGLFLLDGSVLDGTVKPSPFLLSSGPYRKWIRNGFVAGGFIQGAEHYSRSEISSLIAENQ